MEQNILHCVRKNPPLIPIISEMKFVQSLSPYFLVLIFHCSENVNCTALVIIIVSEESIAPHLQGKIAFLL
jgi:hypothetical protein